jgi:hypothetical protein
MKLRLANNSVRLRLTRSEVDQFLDTGLAEEAVDFPNTPLVFMLHSSSDCRSMQATFVNGWITVTVPDAAGKTWAGSDQVGMEGSHHGVSILIEKDWQCLHAAGDEDAFPRP